MKDVPLLVLANKQDLLNTLSQEMIIEELNLDSMKSRPWAIMPCSARNGKGLDEGIDWIITQIKLKGEVS
jgi:signal recognition particle receptor subunit beta